MKHYHRYRSEYETERPNIWCEIMLHRTLEDARRVASRGPRGTVRRIVTYPRGEIVGTIYPAGHPEFTKTMEKRVHD